MQNSENLSAKILSEHQDLYTPIDLMIYLQNYFKKRNLDFVFYLDNNDVICGEFDGVPFMIDFWGTSKGKIMTLSFLQDFEEDFQEEEKMLKMALAPVMWSQQKTKKPIYAAPIYSYKKLNSEICEISNYTVWDTYNPEKNIQELAKDQLLFPDEYIEIKVFYKPELFEKAKDSLFFGNNPGKISQEHKAQIEKDGEFAIFFKLRELLDEYDKKKFDIKDERKLDELERDFQYAYCFLMQQTKRFGVKVNKPDPEPVEPTTEFLAWIDLWDASFSRAEQENANILVDWQNEFDCGYDPNFKPPIKLKEYLPYFEIKMQVLDEIERKKEFDEFNTNSKKTEEETRIYNEREKRLDGRTQNIVNEVFKDFE